MQEIKRINNNSDLFAVFIAETLICVMIDAIISIPFLSVIVTLVILTGILVNNHGRVMLRDENSILLIALIVVVLFLSIFLNGLDNVLTYAMNFVCFGIGAFVFSSIEISQKRTIQTLVRVYCLYLVIYVLILRRSFLSSSKYWNNQMGMAYGFAQIIILSFLIWFYPHLGTEDRKYKWVVLIIGLLASGFLLADTGTRGAIVVVMIGVASIVLTKQTNTIKIFLVVFVGCCAVIIVTNYKEIIIVIAGMLSKRGINIGAINKMVFMIKNGNEMNGRDTLAIAANLYFLQSPVLGNGVGYFEKMQGTYPHNLLRQLLCEYGVVGTIMVIALLIKRVLSIFFCEKAALNHLELYVFLSSVPMLFFSNTYWLLPLFWIFLFMNGRNILKEDNWEKEFIHETINE